MYSITRQAPIECLGLSQRSYNCLRRTGIVTVGQLLEYPSAALPGIRNMGRKSLAEIQERIARLQNGELSASLSSSAGDAAPPPLPDIPVQDLGLSVRAVNALQKSGVFSASQLGDVTKADLLAMGQLGPKTIREVLEKLETLRRQAAAVQGAAGETDALLDSLAAFTRQPRSVLLQELYACAEEPSEAPLVLRLCRRESVRRMIRSALLSLLDEGPSTPSALLAHMPPDTAPEILEGFLEDLERRNAITRQDGLVLRRYPTALEYASTRSEGRNREMLLERLKGKTLEEIGREHHLTRERVRQLNNKELQDRPRLHEDQYQDLFNRYEFSLESFTLAFGEPPEAYYYLEILRPRKTRPPLRDMLGDESVPRAYRLKAERAVYRQYVQIDGVRVEKSRPALAEYTVRTRCRELTTMPEFVERYQALLDEAGLDGEAFAMEPRTYENRLNNCDYVLWNQWRRFRYYPIRQREYGPLLEALNLEQYENLEITSLKLFRDHPDLMEEYDIRDEYELHNLLRKIWPPDSPQQIDFVKMPTIQIGAPDRDRQVLDLLLQSAPILNSDLAEKYEALYGAKSSTVLSNYFSCISRYLQGSVYRIDMPALPQAHHDRLAQLLSGDFYLLSDIRRTYRQAFPDSADLSRINAMTLRDLGFRVYTDYVVRDTYAGAADYFRRLLTCGEADMRETARQFTGVTLYSSELSDLKNQLEIVEFSPGQYLSRRRLQEMGVSLEQLKDYGAAAARFVEPGTYFTVESLRRDGFSHVLDQAGFDSWFYSSLLAVDPRFSCRRMGKNRLFCAGRDNVLLSDFLTWLLEDRKRMELQELMALLKERYAVSFPKDKLIDVIRSSTLFYAPIMNAVYINYDAYARDI